MPGEENTKIDINKHEVDIDTLFKQNENDLESIKELYKRLGEIEERIEQIKFIDNQLANKLKKEYEKLKKFILDENIQITLNEKIDNVQVQLDEKIERAIQAVKEEEEEEKAKRKNGDS